MSTHERFHVVFDGPALAGHKMDVRDLVPALMAITNLLTAANEELNGKAAVVRVEVQASFKVGSFGIDLTFSQALLHQLRDLFAGSTAAAIANAGGILSLLGLTYGGTIGLIALLRRLRGRPPVRIEQEGTIARVWISETEPVEVDRRVLQLLSNAEVRTCLEKVLSPLRREGISEFRVVKGDNIQLEIRAVELGWYDAIASVDSQVVSEFTARKLLLLEAVVFHQENRWRFHDGRYVSDAVMDDPDFLARVDKGMRFGKGDVLDADVLHTQRVENGVLKAECRIVKVHEHHHPPQQPLL